MSNYRTPNQYAPQSRAALAGQMQQTAATKKVSFTAGGSTVELSMRTVRDYLVTGDRDRVSDKELVMFINLCKYACLNPWLREAYCIKYGNEPATLVVGKGAFEKRADDHPQYDGIKAGIIVYSQRGIEYRDGALYLPDETIVGGWAEVFRKDRAHSSRVEVSFEEYVGRKRDGSTNGQWAKKPATMIRKVAVVQALREAFPGTFSGMYDAAEMNVDEEILDATPIDQNAPAIPAEPAAPVIDVPPVSEEQEAAENDAEPEQVDIDAL